jgi:chemotaxis protein MotA
MSPILGISGIVFAIWFFIKYEGHNGFTGYFQMAGFVLLLVGPPSIMLLSHTISDFLTGFKLLLSSMFSRVRKHHEEVIETLSAASKAVRSEGLGAVIPFKEKARYDLLRDGLAMIMNDFKTDEIRNNLMARVNLKQSHMQSAANLFENMSRLSPGVGMIGTLMGLIGMLSNMSDPSKIGSNMALAMITTLYGLGLGTIIYGPWGEKVMLEAEKSLEVDLLVVEGVLNIKSKKSSVHLKDLVRSYSAGSNKSAAKGGSGQESSKGA